MRSLGDVLYNFHWVVPGEAARSAQAYAGRLGPFLTRHRIRSLVNLRGRNPKFGWWRYEARVTEALGISHVDVPLDSRHLPRRDMLVALFEAFDSAPKPFLVKCSGGQDRTSLAAALYVLHREGWGAIEKANAQFSRWPYLHFPKVQQRWLKHFIDFARQDAAGRPIADWVRTSYTPERLRDWLETHGHTGTFKGIFERPSPAHKWQW
ncbi:MAG TPA: hypothetical protein VMU08_11365 [Rhizomicrobium sp.]|nr:hypothetical protein [Rhizomicrobium sp.]